MLLSEECRPPGLHSDLPRLCPRSLWTSSPLDLGPGGQSDCALPTPCAQSHPASLAGSLRGVSKAKQVSWLENLVRSKRQKTKNVERYIEINSLYRALITENAIKKTD